MGSDTRCHFVNPKYESLYDQPCYPSLEALPERPGRRDRRAEPAAGGHRHPGRCRRRHSGRDHPGRRRRRGRRGRGGHAGGRGADRPRSRPGPGRTELHGRDRPDRQRGDLHRRRLALPAPGRGGRHRPVGLGHRRLRPLRLAGRLLADHQLRLRGRARRLRLPGLLPGRPGDELGHPVRRGVQAPGAVPGTGRPGARAGQADHGRQGRPELAGPGRGDRPFRLARRRDPGHGRRPGRRRGHPLHRPGRAARDRGAGRGGSTNRAERGSRANGRGDRVDGRRLADRRPRAGHRRRPAADPARGPGADPRRPADHGLRRQPARSVGCRGSADRVRGGLRGDGRQRRVRRPGPRPRLPVPIGALRGRHGQRRHPAAPGRDAGTAVAAAGLRVADLRRAATGDEGGAGRPGRRRAASPRGARGVPGDRRRGPMGRPPCAAPDRRPVATRLAGAGREPDLVRRGRAAG